MRRVEVESDRPTRLPDLGRARRTGALPATAAARDVPTGGPVELIWVKRRWFCDQGRCPRGTFSEVTDQVPAFARSTARLCQALVAAVVVSGRAASEVARAHQVSWWLVASMLTAAADLLGDPDEVRVRRLGVDEHRYRSVRFFRDGNGGWRRSDGVGAWLAARSPAWWAAVEVVAIDPSAAFARRCMSTCRPRRSAWTPSTWSSWQATP